jgi:type IX secretion system PorP/SprF family membrane protein
MRKRLFIFIIGLSSGLLGITQTMPNLLNFSQYMFHQPFVNPASINSYNNINAALLYKAEFMGFNNAPVFQALSVNSPIAGSKTHLGFTVQNEERGVTQFSNASVTYGYNVHLTSTINMGLAVSAKAEMLQKNLSKARVNDLNDEMLMTDIDPYFVPNFDLGIYFFSDDFFFGATAPEFFDQQMGNASFREKDFPFYAHAGYMFGSDIEVTVASMVKHYYRDEYMIDGYGFVEFYETFGIGAAYRSSLFIGETIREANILNALAKVTISRMFTIGYAFDYNLDSEIQNYTTGSHEIMLLFNPDMSPDIPLVR